RPGRRQPRRSQVMENTTMPEVTLEAMIRRISREAEREFNKHGDLIMLWLLDAPDKGIATFAMSYPEGAEAKDAFVAAVREFLRERNVTRYARACEGWMPAAAVRYSSELRDDEGRVFVTDVPGSPFQIMGRRDPRTGELCVSHWVCVAYEDHRVAL